MEGADEDGAVGKTGLRAMPEPGTVARRQLLPPARRLQPRLVADAAERDHDAHAIEKLDLADHERPARFELASRRPVRRRGAPGGGRDPGAEKGEAVVAGNGSWLAGEP